MNIFGHSRRLLKGNEQGTLILQGLIATAIFGVFMTSVVYIMTATVRANKTATRITEATAIAADTLERIAVFANDPRVELNTYPDETVGDYTVSVITQADLVVPNSISIEVEVRWNDRTGQRVLAGQRFRNVVMQDTLYQD